MNFMNFIKRRKVHDKGRPQKLCNVVQKKEEDCAKYLLHSQKTWTLWIIDEIIIVDATSARILNPL